jgi:hypothetical protein
VKLAVGELVPLELQLDDGNAGVFPRALVYDAGGALVATRDLAHVAAGRYASSAQTMPNTTVLAATYVVYSDAGHTVDATATYPRALDTWQLDANAAAIAAGFASVESTLAGMSSDIADVLTGISAILTSVANAQTAIDAVAANVVIALGLAHHNARVDTTAYGSSGVLTAARVRQFADAAALAASNPAHGDGVDGEIHRWRITAVDNGAGGFTDYKLIQEL